MNTSARAETDTDCQMSAISRGAALSNLRIGWAGNRYVAMYETCLYSLLALDSLISAATAYIGYVIWRARREREFNRR